MVLADSAESLKESFIQTEKATGTDTDYHHCLTQITNCFPTVICLTATITQGNLPSLVLLGSI